MLPGGGVWFDETNGYAEAGVHIYDIAKQMNDNGNYFPLFGICLGFELLLYASNGEREYRTICSSSKQNNTLNFTKGLTGTTGTTGTYREIIIANYKMIFFSHLIIRINEQIFGIVVCLAKHHPL